MNLTFAFDPEKCVAQSIIVRYTDIKLIVDNNTYKAWIMKYNYTRDVIIAKLSNGEFHYINLYMYVRCIIGGICGDIITICEGSIKSSAVSSNNKAAQLFKMAGMAIWCLLNTDKLYGV